MNVDSSVDNAVQILATDDDRNPSFSPLLWDRPSRKDQQLEQIWMPGVHSDIGGCSDGRFLGNVALLTMVERIRKYCPELEFDDGYLEKEVLHNIRTADRIEITDERSGVLRKFLRRSPRIIGEQSCEYVHSMFSYLIDRQFAIKGAQKRYTPENYARHLPVMGAAFDSELRDICERLSSRVD